MARKSKAEVNRQLFKKANNYHRKKWFSDSQKSCLLISALLLRAILIPYFKMW